MAVPQLPTEESLLRPVGLSSIRDTNRLRWWPRNCFPALGTVSIASAHSPEEQSRRVGHRPDKSLCARLPCERHVATLPVFTRFNRRDDEEFLTRNTRRGLMMPMAHIEDVQNPDMSAVHNIVPCPGAHLPLVCFSHLRWGFVWQRPQHLMTRFARTRPVYVIEEPMFHGGRSGPDLVVTRDGGVTILTPSLPDGHEPFGEFCDTTTPVVRQLLSAYFSNEGVTEAIIWYYTPMALGALPGTIEPALTVFDAMDELANFRGAPRELRTREQALMSTADLVFAGGPSLYHARKHRHPSVHCFPSGVDAAHFAQQGLGIPGDVASLPRPIVGYYGVLDERVDFALIDAMAAARPDWSIVMVGPVVKIEEDDLAHAPNIHYLGMRAYHDLPAYLAAFDVAILPFGCNDATRFISPTKTLEYLAAGKPAVSTPIRDVVDLYGTVVEIADGPEAFTAAIECAWNEPPAVTAERISRSRALLTAHSWDGIANAMEQQIELALVRSAQSSGRTVFPGRPIDEAGVLASAVSRGGVH